MADGAVSHDFRVQRQLDRLTALAAPGDRLGLERISALLDRLGNPERDLPPIFHVAGTNGKGSTCAFLRAAAEAAGLAVHVYTTPHLIRLNERIRLRGTLIGDDALAELLDETIAAAGDIRPSFFELTTAAAIRAFARSPADLCIIEVGMGGRGDATNVVPAPACCGIAQLAIDHKTMLGDRIEAIAREKAGIAKRGTPLVTQAYSAPIGEEIAAVAAEAGAPWIARGERWEATALRGKLHYRDAKGGLELPLPRLPGAHQASNAMLAVAMVRHQEKVAIPDAALRAAMEWTDWPARLQRLAPGPLTGRLPRGAELWLDGGHNPAAARAPADFFRAAVPADYPFHVILGLLRRKDSAGVLKSFSGRSLTLHTVAVPGHDSYSPAELHACARSARLSAVAAASVTDALDWIARHASNSQPPIVLVFGSLHLAGQVLEANLQVPS
ncbi:MAG: bifunctional folylpolyglutamate synthase/dihydrofolate synthase [Allosphingosinicella sp.]